MHPNSPSGIGINTNARMSSREKILSMVQKNQPAGSPLPEIHFAPQSTGNPVEQFIQTVTAIGGEVIRSTSLEQVSQKIRERFPDSSRIINAVPDSGSGFEFFQVTPDPHDFRNVTLSILRGEFGVAENGGIWLTDEQMGNPVLPYISEHLVLILHQNDIVSDLHEAYGRIGQRDYRLGTFIAGPSKTADIEQSLVLGAHGPKSLIVFLLD